MEDLTIWITYHNDNQIEEYRLKEDGTFRLFKGNDINIEGDNINYLNPYYSEIVTIYWVWKNQKVSRNVGFCHYRRMFKHVLDVEKGCCQVMAINPRLNVMAHYKVSHNYQDMYDIIDILNNQYGENNKYTKYLLNSNTFIPFCCFIMEWSDFDGLCKFLFPVLIAYDKKNHLNMNPVKYRNKAELDFRYDNIEYQQRAISFLAERLISAYIVCNLSPMALEILDESINDKNSYHKK